MSRIVEGLSFLARHDADHLRPSVPGGAVNLVLIIRKATADFERQASEKQVALHCSIPDTPAWVEGNETQLHQLIRNLVDNAIKYTLPNGSVSLLVTEKTSTGKASNGPLGKQYAIVVTDTGIGIAENYLPYIFHRFWRGDPARAAGGSGLGLAICKQIVELHQGVIWAESKPGYGTTVQVVLPAYC